MIWRACVDTHNLRMKGSLNVKQMFINTTYIIVCPLGDQHISTLIEITRQRDVGVQLHLNCKDRRQTHDVLRVDP